MISFMPSFMHLLDTNSQIAWPQLHPPSPFPKLSPVVDKPRQRCPRHHSCPLPKLSPVVGGWAHRGGGVLDLLDCICGRRKSWARRSYLWQQGNRGIRTAGKLLWWRRNRIGRWKAVAVVKMSDLLLLSFF